MTPDLERIEHALNLAAKALEPFTPGAIEAAYKHGDDPITEADLAVDTVLREALPDDGEGWLSEETKDTPERLEMSRLWVVDPIDGTREFVQGLPQWCVSIGLVVDGVPVAGGVVNPAADELILGALGHGVTLNGEPVTEWPSCLAGGEVLASNSEIKRGEWDEFMDLEFDVVPMGSVAYKLARVGAGMAPATWTLVPKNEWDVAAGVAIVHSARGRVITLDDGEAPRFNRRDTLFKGLIASGPGLHEEVLSVVSSAAFGR